MTERCRRTPSSPIGTQIFPKRAWMWRIPIVRSEPGRPSRRLISRASPGDHGHWPWCHGKTTLLRWLCERALEQNEDDLALATVDPVNRELGHFFPAAMAPPTQDPTHVTAWLEQLLAMVMETRKSVALDFGGGDRAWPVSWRKCQTFSR